MAGSLFDGLWPPLPGGGQVRRRVRHRAPVCRRLRKTVDRPVSNSAQDKISRRTSSARKKHTARARLDRRPAAGRFRPAILLKALAAPNAHIAIINLFARRSRTPIYIRRWSIEFQSRISVDFLLEGHPFLSAHQRRVGIDFHSTCPEMVLMRFSSGCRCRSAATGCTLRGFPILPLAAGAASCARLTTGGEHAAGGADYPRSSCITSKMEPSSSSRETDRPPTAGSRRNE